MAARTTGANGLNENQRGNALTRAGGPSTSSVPARIASAIVVLPIHTRCLHAKRAVAEHGYRAIEAAMAVQGGRALTDLLSQEDPVFFLRQARNDPSTDRRPHDPHNGPRVE